MRTALIGHRGVGKTSLLKRIAFYAEASGRKIKVIDLDEEIENRSSRRISDIFQSQGEEVFRALERDVFAAIDSETSQSSQEVYVALGAGFDPQLIPEAWHVLWIRRNSDEAGRIFLDRPRLNSSVPTLLEYQERYLRRKAAYLARADEVLWIDEGIEESDSAEGAFFQNDIKLIDGDLTLLPSDFRSVPKAEQRLNKRAQWGVRWFELRDDLLTPEQMELAVRLLPDERILISFRHPKRRSDSLKLVERNALAFDWPLELGACDFGEPRVLSLHERKDGQSLTDALLRFPADASDESILKAALPVHNFKELMAGHKWAQAKPEKRVFLPISSSGRWAWYRLLMASQSQLNFFRESEGSSLDQPTLLQWVRALQVGLQAGHSANILNTQRFAAVLGDPIKHSRTPIEQSEFFSQKGAPVFAIQVSEEEFRSGALEILHELGLRWAAITSPLKTASYELSTLADQESASLKSVNTLRWSQQAQRWLGGNTDFAGFQALVASTRETSGDLGRVAVWGGGGTLPVVKTVLPEAQYYSLRTGENRSADGPPAESFSPDTLIWAGTSSGGAKSLPSTWQPKLIIDLNYAESSLARAYALEKNARYISGLKMFKAQAKAQRKFWEHP